MPIVPAKRPITITDLLTHTAGISYGTERRVAALYEAKGLGPAAGSAGTRPTRTNRSATTMERLASLPFVAQPGEAWVYGYNTDILGCVVERASGMPLDQFFQTRITGPLGMKDTHFFLPPEKRTAWPPSTPAHRRPDRPAPDGPRGQGTYVDGPRRNFAGGAGLLSTARDYARFLEMVRNGGALGRRADPGAANGGADDAQPVGLLHGGNVLGFSLAFETTERVGGNGLDPVGAYGWGGAYGRSTAWTRPRASCWR